MKPYEEAYPVGAKVQIASREKLDAFYSDWKNHNKLMRDQLEYAGRLAEVQAVSYYHGGDVLYQLKNVPGIWHEQLLRAEIPS